MTPQNSAAPEGNRGARENTVALTDDNTYSPENNKDTLSETLAAAGYQPGETFELCALVLAAGAEKKSIDPAWFVVGQDDDAARAWIASRAELSGIEGGCYITTNPVTPGARAWGHRSENVDVTSVRILLIDPDPLDATPDARAEAARVADEIRALLVERLNVRPALVDSGRGRQIWLQHEVTSDDVSDLRKALILALGARFNCANVIVDKSTHNAARLMRLPGTTNLKTGDTARIIDAGDGQAAQLSDMRALAEELAPGITTTTTKTKKPGKRRPGTRLPVAPAAPLAPEARAAIYSGCAAMRAWRDRQEGGQAWKDRETWRLGAGVLLALDDVAEVDRLDLLAGGHGADVGVWRTAPTSCRALASGMLSDSACPPELRAMLADCGTDHSPCGFASHEGAEPSPARHASHVTSTAAAALADPADVRAEMERALQAGAGDLVLAGGCGSHKSSLLRAKIIDDSARYLVASPTHDLAEEWRRDLVTAGAVTREVVRVPGVERACELPSSHRLRARMRALRLIGESATRACFACDRRETSCPYWRARRQAPEARIVIVTHALLATRSCSFGSDRRLVIDEDPLDALVPRHELDRAQLARLARALPVADLSPIVDRNKLADLADWLLAQLDATKSCATLSAADVPADLLSALDDEEVEEEEAVPLMRWARALRADRSDVRPVALLEPRSDVAARLTLAWRAPIPRSMPVVIADATADVEALGLALGRELAPVGSATTPTGSLVRYHDVSASREALATPGPRRDRALAVVDALLARHAGQRIGAVTTLALERELAPRVARVSHYGAARGSNTMRDGSIDVGIVLGVPRVPPHALRAWAIFVGGASLTDLEEQPSSRPLRDGSASVRVWSYREGSALARADHALTSAALRQAVGRFAGVQTVYVIADYPLGLGEELRAACHDLRVPLLPRPSRGGRPALDLAPLVEAARAHVAAGGDLLAHGATAACVRAAQPLGWRGTDRAARLRWDDVIAAVVEETCR